MAKRPNNPALSKTRAAMRAKAATEQQKLGKALVAAALTPMTALAQKAAPTTRKGKR